MKVNYRQNRGIERMAEDNTTLYATLRKLMDRCAVSGADKVQFKAKELGLNGTTLSRLAYYNFLEIVGKEECWYQIDEDTMKRGEVNVYLFDPALVPDDIFERIRDEKVNKVERRIERLKAQLAKAYEALEEI